jgi:hypothetical protein
MEVRALAFALAVATAQGAGAQEQFRSPSSESAVRASRFLSELTARSPTHDGAPLRSHWIQDVDLDGKFEVLESLSTVEEKSTGFLSAENSPPCSWTRVYREGADGFSEATASFPEFLRERQVFYQHWMQYFDATGSDPQGARACTERNLSRVEALISD